jgi:hypothetical protein
MLARWIPITLCCLSLGHWAFAGDDSSDELQQAFSSERVQIVSIGGKSIVNHPPVIEVLPGERILLRADVLKSVDACTNPDGCPEKRAADEFSWTADDRIGDQCEARHPHACLSRSSFERDDDDQIIFHIPYAMEENITLRVAHESLPARDQIVLHNARSTEVSQSTPAYDDEDHKEIRTYPTLTSWEMDEPVWGPNTPCYYYAWGPYPYYTDRGVWGCSNLPIGLGWYFGPTWGWGWPYGYWGWYGPYHRGWYGYGYGYGYPYGWRANRVLVGRTWGFGELRYNRPPAVGYEARPYSGSGFRSGYGRGGRR